MATTQVGAGEIFGYNVAANAEIPRTCLVQRTNGRFPIPWSLFRVWDAVGVGLPTDGNLEAGSVVASIFYDPTLNDATFFVANRAYRVVDIRGRVEVAGNDAGAVTGVVKKAASGTDIAAGTALHSGTFDLKGTVDTDQTLTLSATSSALDIPAGTAIGFDLTGTPTLARGAVSVLLALAASPDDLVLVNGTFGSSPAYVGTGDVKAGGTTTKYARLFIPVPPDFEGANTTLTMRLTAAMKTTIADTSANVLVEAWRVDADGTLGIANIVTTLQQSMNTTVPAAYDFNLDPTTLLPGDMIEVRVKITVVDAATVTAVIGAIYLAELQADLR